MWNLDHDEAAEVQKIEFKGRLPLDIEVGFLPGSACEYLLCSKRLALTGQLWSSLLATLISGSKCTPNVKERCAMRLSVA